jgi:hypothetical protein
MYNVRVIYFYKYMPEVTEKIRAAADKLISQSGEVGAILQVSERLQKETGAEVVKFREPGKAGLLNVGSIGFVGLAESVTLSLGAFGKQAAGQYQLDFGFVAGLSGPLMNMYRRDSVLLLNFLQTHAGNTFRFTKSFEGGRVAPWTPQSMGQHCLGIGSREIFGFRNPESGQGMHEFPFYLANYGPRVLLARVSREIAARADLSVEDNMPVAKTLANIQSTWQIERLEKTIQRDAVETMMMQMAS